MNLKKQLYSPLYLVLGFNVFTLIFFITAPFDWSQGKPNAVILYLLVNYLFIFLGYKFGLKRSLLSRVNIKHIFSTVNSNLTKFIFIFYLLTFLVKYAYLLRFSIFDVSGMFSYLLIGLFDSELGYNLSVYDYRPHTISWILFIFVSLFNQLFFIYGFLCWRNIRVYYRILFVFFVCVELFYWLGRGTGYGVISLVSTFAICYFISLKEKKINLRSLLLYSVLIISVFLFYGTLKNLRAGGGEVDLNQFDLGMAAVQDDHYIFSVIPKSQTQGYMHNTSYLTQGYYHLGLAMTLEDDFNSTLLLGNNPASINLLKSFDFDLWQQTYMYRLSVEKGVDDLGKWHSAYLWYANDVSLYGVPFIMFILAYLMAYSYGLVLSSNDLLSKILFVIFVNMLLYNFANNTYLYHHFYSLTMLLLIWLPTRLLK